jgi:hypothetical protein
MANDLLYKASLPLGASPQNKRSSLLYKIPTVGNRQQLVVTNMQRLGANACSAQPVARVIQYQCQWHCYRIKRRSSVFLRTQVSPSKPHASPSKNLGDVSIGYLDKLHGYFSIAHAARQSPPIFLGALEFSIHLHSSPCMHGLGSNHGLTLLVIGARMAPIGTRFQSMPISPGS